MTHLLNLEEMTDSSSGADGRALGACLTSLRSNLDEHFRFEERNGYMDAVLARAPQMARQVEGLREEHAEMRQSLIALAAQARKARSVDDELRQKVRDWVAKVRNHERRENLLVEDTFNRDLGAKD